MGQIKTCPLCGAKYDAGRNGKKKHQQVACALAQRGLVSVKVDWQSRGGLGWDLRYLRDQVKESTNVLKLIERWVRGIRNHQSELIPDGTDPTVEIPTSQMVWHRGDPIPVEWVLRFRDEETVQWVYIYSRGGLACAPIGIVLETTD